MTIVHDFFQVSVLVAIALFAIREILVDVRNVKTNRRRRRAISALLAEELEQNYLAFDRLYGALSALSGEARSACRITHSAFGPPRFSTEKINQTLGGAIALHPFVTWQYERLLEKVAELDMKLFGTLQKAYSALSALERSRSSLIALFSESMWSEGERSGMHTLLSGDFGEMHAHFQDLDAAYYAMTHSHLDAVKLFDPEVKPASYRSIFQQAYQELMQSKSVSEPPNQAMQPTAPRSDA